MRREFVAAWLASLLCLWPAPTAAAGSICQFVAAGQSGGCQWTGTITVDSSGDITQNTTFPPGINEHGGTQIDEARQSDTTTILVQGDRGLASRDYQLVHTITQHLLPGAQCGVAQPLTYGTHDKSFQQQDTARGSDQVAVSVDIDPTDGTYSIVASRPSPPTTTVTTFKETWAICNAPPPQDSTQTSTRPAGDPVPLPIGGSGQVDPNNPGVLDGSASETDASGIKTTINWHLTRNCNACDEVQALVDAQTARLQIDNASLTVVLDQVSSLLSTASAESPELLPKVAVIEVELAQLDAVFQAAPLDGQAYAEAAVAWFQGPGAGDLAVLQSQVGGASGAPNPTLVNALALMQVAQQLEGNVAADQASLQDAQVKLLVCQAGATQ